MNFQDARNLQGQMDAKGYQMGVDMVGTVRAVEPKKFSDKGKPFQQVTIQDSTGETIKVKIWLGNGPDVLPTDVGTQQSFQQVAVNPYKDNIYYKAFWDNMHPPQGQPPQSHLNAATQEIIDRHRQPSSQQAAEAIETRMGGTLPAPALPVALPPIPTQQDYAAKERAKAIGMCMHGYLVAEIGNRPLVEVWEDKATVQAAHQLGVTCVDGMGQILDQEARF